MTGYATEIMRKGPQRYDMTGRALARSLHVTDEIISHGLAARLYHYATGRLEDSGFEFAISWQGVVYTTDSEYRPSERAYSVSFTNSKGGQITLSGILTRAGWPCVDHGFYIETNQ